jgi:hypothetical protein
VDRGDAPAHPIRLPGVIAVSTRIHPGSISIWLACTLDSSRRNKDDQSELTQTGASVILAGLTHKLWG